MLGPSGFSPAANLVHKNPHEVSWENPCCCCVKGAQVGSTRTLSLVLWQPIEGISSNSLVFIQPNRLLISEKSQSGGSIPGAISVLADENDRGIIFLKKVPAIPSVNVGFLYKATRQHLNQMPADPNRPDLRPLHGRLGHPGPHTPATACGDQNNKPSAGRTAPAQVSRQNLHRPKVGM